MNHFPRRPRVSHYDRFKLGPAAKLLPVAMTPAAKLPPVSTTPAANFATSFASVVEFSPVSTILAANLPLVSMTLVANIGKTISDSRNLQMNLKAKIYIYVNSTTQRCPNKIIKNCLIKDFSHLPPVSKTLVVHFKLQKSPQIGLGGNWLIKKSEVEKISWHCRVVVS